MSPLYYLATGAGGALGAIMRLFCSHIFPETLFSIPAQIILINIIGCFLMGFLTEFLTFYWSPPDIMRYFLITGFLGGFTTFSAFTLEFGLLYNKQFQGLAFMYAAASVIFSILFFFFGIKIVQCAFKYF